MDELEIYYSQKISASEKAILKIKNKLALGSAGRLLFFLLISYAVYQLFHAFQTGWLLFLISSLAGFLGMISWYVNIKNQEKYQLALNYFYQNELGQIKGAKNLFEDGNSFDDGTGFWSDLDLFGKGSLYHSINRTVTQYGQAALANQFKNQFLDCIMILRII